MQNHTTLPEGMVAVTKDLVRAYEAYCRQIEEMIVVREALRTQIDRLTTTGTRYNTNDPGTTVRLDNINPDFNVPMVMPEAIKPMSMIQKAHDELIASGQLPAASMPKGTLTQEWAEANPRIQPQTHKLVPLPEAEQLLQKQHALAVERAREDKS